MATDSRRGFSALPGSLFDSTLASIPEDYRASQPSKVRVCTPRSALAVMFSCGGRRGARRGSASTCKARTLASRVLGERTLPASAAEGIIDRGAPSSSSSSSPASRMAAHKLRFVNFDESANFERVASSSSSPTPRTAAPKNAFEEFGAQGAGEGKREREREGKRERERCQERERCPPLLLSRVPYGCTKKCAFVKIGVLFVY